MGSQHKFKIESPFEASGDQPQAIKELCEGIERGERNQVLLGVTGSGKTFTMAKIIEQCQRPALIMEPNKILAAQLYAEMKEFFPHNNVEYFVSYYDYYQPEAYIPKTDTYIEKDSAINEQIDRMRHGATRNVLEEKDVQFSVFFRGITITDTKSPFLPNEDTFITIRNVPYTKLKITDVVGDRRKMLLETNKMGNYQPVDDISQPAVYDFVVTVQDKAKITDDGAVVGGNKIKMGIPVILEGKNYKFTGVISNIQYVDEPQQAQQPQQPQQQTEQTSNDKK